MPTDLPPLPPLFPPGAASRLTKRRPPTFSPEERRAERTRRTRVRATLLDRLPPPSAAVSGGCGSFRYDLWPPRPTPVPRASRRAPGGVWTADKLRDRVRTFAAGRGPDFTMQEFLRWGRITSNTIYRHGGSWAEVRVAAGLPAAPASADAEMHTLHALLRTLHLNRHRRRPLTGPELARAAKMSVGPVTGFGGIKQLRNLYRLWVQMHPDDETDDA